MDFTCSTEACLACMARGTLRWTRKSESTGRIGAEAGIDAGQQALQVIGSLMLAGERSSLSPRL